MKTSMKYLLIASAAALLVACGGKSSSSSSSSSGAVTTPALSATPTAVLANTSTEATALAREVKASLTGAQSANGASGLPFGIQVTSLSTGITADLTSTWCTGGGSASYSGASDPNANAAAPVLNSPHTFTFTNCVMYSGGPSMSGSFVLTYTRYNTSTNSATAGPDFAMNVRFNNFVATGGGLTSTQTFSGAIACDYRGSYATNACFYSDGTRSWDTGTSYSGGAANGTYAARYGSGTVSVSLNNFGTVGGTATITGANGYSAVVTYNSATSYTVVITTNGTSTTYNVTV